MSELVLSHGFEQSVDLPAPRHQVFEYLDDFERFGEHMTRSSWMMAASRMRYQFDAVRGRAVGAQLRLTGSFLGVRSMLASATGKFGAAPASTESATSLQSPASRSAPL